MKVRTSQVFRAPRERLWPLLTDSRMELPGHFCLGLPKPVACELPGGEGSVGAERRCRSDRGTVVQRITEWSPPGRLSFRMVSTDHAWAPCIESLEEDFTLKEEAGGVRLTRVTTVKATGALRIFKEMLLAIGLKRVHYYVFGNWRCAVARI